MEHHGTIRPSASSTTEKDPQKQIRRNSKRLGTSCSTCSHGHAVLQLLATYLSLRTLAELLGCFLGIFHAAFNESLALDKNGKHRFPLEPNMIQSYPIYFCAQIKTNPEHLQQNTTRIWEGNQHFPRISTVFCPVFPTSSSPTPPSQSR